MESLKLVEEDANISVFRRRNKMIILVLLFLIISSALIIAALILEVLRLHNTDTSTTQSNSNEVLFSPMRSFCSVSESQSECINAITPIIEDTVIVDPDQILTISLQSSVSQLQKIIPHSNNCSHTLSHALNQLGAPLADMLLNPFVSSLSHYQRGEIWKRIVAADDDVQSCIDDHELTAAEEEKLLQVGVYLNSAQNYLLKYASVLSRIRIYSMNTGSSIYDYLFEMCMCGSQVLFMLGMFFALFRIR